MLYVRAISLYVLAELLGDSGVSFRRSSRVIPAFLAAPPELTIYLAPVKASLMSEVKVMFTPSKPQWNNSSATPSNPVRKGRTNKC